MGFRFWRRVRIAPGVTLNLSKSSGSLSFGPRGAKYTVGSRGRRATVGIPGTGLFYTTSTSKGSRRKSKAPPPVPQKDRLDLGFFDRLFISDNEAALVEGCKQLVAGNETQALENLSKAGDLPDAAFLAGFLALKTGKPEQAARHLVHAAKNHGNLGTLLAKYGVSATMNLAITEEVCAQVGPDLRGALLGLVEACQELGRHEEALQWLEELLTLEPQDVVVKLSLAELLMENPDEATCQRVVRLAEGIENEDAVHAALLLYKGKALHTLNLPEAARDTLTTALRRKKDRPPDLLLALAYERALAYEALGRKSQARKELGKLYAQDPDYEDVAVRLGLGDGMN